MWPLLLAGGAAVAAGNTASYVGARQSNKAQNSAFEEEQRQQDEIDKQAQMLLDNYLDENGPDKRRDRTTDRQNEEQTALNEVAEAVTGGAEQSAANSATSAQGSIQTMGQGVRAGAARRVAPVTRVQAVRGQAVEDDERMRDYMLGRNRLALKAQGRSRLLPMKMNAAGMRGAELKAGGSTLSALGQLLLMYGMNTSPAGTTTPVSTGPI